MAHPSRPMLHLRLSDQDERQGEIPLADLAKVAEETQRVVTRIARGMIDERGPGRLRRSVSDATTLFLVGLRSGSTILDIALPDSADEVLRTEGMPAALGEMASQSAWESLGPVEQAREWEDFRPGTFEQVFEIAKLDASYRRKMAEQAARHERRLDYIAVSIQVLALTFGLGTVLVLAWVAKYYVDHDAASQGARIFGFGAGSVVAAFVGINAGPFMKRINRRWGRRKEK